MKLQNFNHETLPNVKENFAISRIRFKISIYNNNSNTNKPNQVSINMSFLSDPGNTRVVKTLPLPYRDSLTQKQLFKGRMIDVELLTKFFQNEGVLDERLVRKILKESREMFNMEPNIVHINDPLTIVGDIHGQYYDLMQIMNMQIAQTSVHRRGKYLFLGDYVDRGLFAVQVVLVIISMKINSPKSVFILRGNHQCRQLTTYFNFKNQCLQYYNQQVYDQFIDLFCSLPLAAIVNKRFLCIHGGISTNIQTVQDIMRVNRFGEVPQSGLFCDLLWADPIDNSQGKLKGMVSFNQIRGCSYNFGYSLTKNLLKNNKLDCIIRAHQAKQEGFQMHKWAGANKFPPVITVFSAPNYCDFYNNKGAIIRIQNNILQIKQIKSNSHPFYLPNNQTLFEWSIPFIAQKVTEMFNYLLKPDSDIPSSDEILIELIDRQKLIQQLLKLQQEEVEDKMEVVKYQGKVLGEELLHIGKAREYAMNVWQKDFSIEKSIDKINQKRPLLDETGQTSSIQFKLSVLGNQINL